VLKVYAEIDDGAPPPCWLLAIRGERYELGDGLSAEAAQNLPAALHAAVEWLLAGQEV
jgi:hypothetical protein